ncbi:CRISPR-associated protein, Cas5e family [uncultured Desulfobacterium sp.]|uniref:CRISPR-associated protein, Cas5e family n=1 Tax=uncultured Desulfobacterium sp. TaxID=201089 RepID=A0A445MSE3_9BACT|nr:CRISPR-associated protein, Cas5e family [uncultured Desulfobacterium sp.]
MPTLLLRLVGPMQSWGTTSRFDQRDTGKEPSKSGVIGILAAAQGIDRENWMDLEPLTRLVMAVRHDRPGVPKRDYQTAGCAVTDNIIKADGTSSKDGVVSQRLYLADAAFLVGLECDERSLLERAHSALCNPVWPLALGRKSYVPSEPIWIEDGIQDASLQAVFARWPWIASLRKWEAPPEKLLVSFESKDGSGVMKMDQPLSSFAERRFGARFVRSEWIPFP